MRKQPPPHSNLQLTTRKTVLDSWVWLGATEGGYEGHVPHTGRARTQEVVEASKFVGAVVIRDTHQPLKS